MDRISRQRLSGREFSSEIEAFAESLRRQIEADVEGFAPDQSRAKRAADDFEFFSKTYFPHYTTHSQSSVHQWLTQQLPKAISAPRGTRTAEAAPRGEGKSTVVSLQLVLWVTLTNRKKFVLIISDVYAQAATLLAAVKSELEYNPRLLCDFPESTGEGGLWREHAIVLRNGTRIQALGSGQKVRGLRHGPHRPDLIVGDDLENDTHVNTPEQRQKLNKWWGGAVRYAGPPDGSMDVIVVGTVLHHESLLAKLLASPSWKGRRHSAILSFPDRMDLWDKFTEIYNGSGEEPAAREYYAQHKQKMDAGAVVSWPEARPLVELMLLRAEDETAFAAEQLNDPAAGPDAIFSDCLHFYDSLPGGLLKFGSVDPSMGRSGQGDPSAILVGGIVRLQRGRRPLHVLEASIRRRHPDEIISEVIEMQRIHRCLAWAVEATQFQEYFREHMVTASSEAGIPVPAMPVEPHTDKNMRIKSIQPHMVNRLILLSRSHTTLLQQLKHYPEGHDDGPDALHMLWNQAISFMGAGVGGIRSVPRPDRTPISWDKY